MMSVYVVQPGDSLSRIAQRFSTSTQAILGMNPEITNPDLIRVGQRIQIPTEPDAPAAPGVSTPATATEARERLLAEARRLQGTPYRMSPPPDGTTCLDCSLFVVTALRNAGTPLPPGVRTAEQIRQACEPIADWSGVQPGDLLFFEKTYDAGRPTASDGRLATHVGIALSAGPQKMWDCHESPSRDDGFPGVTETALTEHYWLPKMFEARRPPGIAEFEPVATDTGEATYQVTTLGVRLRAAPSTSAEILVQNLGQGTRLTAMSPSLEEADGFRWMHVRTADGTMGWTASQFLIPADTPVAEMDEPNQFVVTAQGVRLRERAGTNQPIVIEDLGQGRRLTAVSTVQRAANGYVWLEVRTEQGATGWVARDFVRLVGAGGAESGADYGLSSEANCQFSFQDLWPCIKQAAAEYGTDAEVIAGITKQESGFKNYIVHHDGTGHGLIGLDDNGMLPDFERWSGMRCGRGHAATCIPPALQLEYCAMIIADYARKYGGAYAAARAWHRGERLRDDERGQNYEALIRAHVRELFGH
jgi:cell wall-associated NlpC family hydrolase